MDIQEIKQKASSWKELGKYIVADMPDGIEVFHREDGSTEGVWNTHDIDYFESEEGIDAELDSIMAMENRL